MENAPGVPGAQWLAGVGLINTSGEGDAVLVEHDIQRGTITAHIGLGELVALAALRTGLPLDKEACAAGTAMEQFCIGFA